MPSSTSGGRRHRFSTAIVAVGFGVSALCSADAARAQGQDVSPEYRCSLPKSEEFGYTIMRRKELQEDAFAEALKPLIDDLQQLEAELGELVDRVGVFERTDCMPFDEDARNLSAELSRHAAECHGAPLEEAAYSACTSAHAQLQAWLTRVQQTHSALQEREAELRRLLADADRRARRARLNAEAVLDYDNIEQVLRLYVWWIQKQRGGPGCHQESALTSCEAFARIADALGRKVKHKDLFVDYLTRTLIEERPFTLGVLSGDPRFRPIAGRAFDATGFQPEYIDQICNNQVRHVLAFIDAGYHRLRTPAVVVSFFADYVADTEQDFALAVQGAQLGVNLRIAGYTTRTFGGAFRSQICRR